jgi:hypothetical protein
MLGMTNNGILDFFSTAEVVMEEVWKMENRENL